MATKTKKDAVPLRDLLTPPIIAALTDQGSYKRGEDYARRGKVAAINEYQGRIVATVTGTSSYNVKLWIDNGEEIGFSCNCPVGLEGWFCKHCVATALVWYQENGEGGDGGKNKKKKKSDPLTELATALAKLSKEELVAIIMDQAMGDDELRARLMMKMMKSGESRNDAETYRGVVDAITAVGGYIDYHETMRIASSIEGVMESLHDMVRQGEPAKVLELIHYTVLRVGTVLLDADDSDGYLSGVLEELEDLYKGICKRELPIDTSLLAEHLLTMELGSCGCAFDDAYKYYGSLLGEEGRKRYYELVLEKWGNERTKKPGQFYSDSQYRLKEIMESLAGKHGNIDMMVAIKAGEVVKPQDYLDIIQLCSNANRPDDALEWAEKGNREFSKHEALRDCLIAEYERRGMYEKMMKLAWERFTMCPTITDYTTFITLAQKAGEKKKWYEEVMKVLKNPPPKKRHNSPDYRHLRMCILLHEKEYDAAWELAIEGDCSPHQWLEIAAGRAETHPQDSVAIYHAQIDELCGTTSDQAYSKVIFLLEKLRPVMHQTTGPAGFNEYLDELRATYRTRRKFMAMIEEKFPMKVNKR